MTREINGKEKKNTTYKIDPAKKDGMLSSLGLGNCITLVDSFAAATLDSCFLIGL